MSCPKCNREFSDDELTRILEQSGVSKKAVETVKKELAKQKVAKALQIFKPSQFSASERAYGSISVYDTTPDDGQQTEVVNHDVAQSRRRNVVSQETLTKAQSGNFDQNTLNAYQSSYCFGGHEEDSKIVGYQFSILSCMQPTY